MWVLGEALPKKKDLATALKDTMIYFRFITIWILLFAVSFAILSSLNMAPKNILSMNQRVFTALAFSGEADTQVGGAPNTAEVAIPASLPMKNAWTTIGVEPERIVIEKIGVSSNIVHPKTTDIPSLDAELKKGVVHYPGSGYLNENSNLFLFGHSTGLTNVHNESYRAFNGLGKLNIGDVVKLYAGNEMYEYSVVGLSLAKSNEALVTFSNDKKMLTLSTCDTFGKKEDRFVVTAVFVRQVTLANNY